MLSPSAVFDYEPGLLGVLFDGGLLCLWNSNRTLECPGLEEGLRSSLAVSEVTEADFVST